MAKLSLTVDGRGLTADLARDLTNIVIRHTSLGQKDKTWQTQYAKSLVEDLTAGDIYGKWSSYHG